jgi:WD40 repeat protein
MFSPDGKRIASDGQGGRITLWDTRTGVEVMTFAGHWDRISSIAFTPDGSRMISGSFDKQIKIWDVSTGKELRTLAGNEDCVWALAVSPDGARIVSTNWEPLSLGPDCEIKIWDTDMGEVLRTLKGHTLGVHHLALDSQGKRILSSSFDITQRMWDIETGDEIMRFDGQGCAIFSPDDKRIIAGQGNGQIKIWDVASRSEVANLRGHGDRIPALTVSPDGRRIASGSLDNTVKVWDMATGAEVMTISSSAAVRAVEFSPNGESLAFSCSDGHATLLESSVPAGGYKARRLGAAARELVDEMHETHGSYSDVIAQLEDDERASEPVGELAIQIAHARLWHDTEKKEAGK